MKRLHIDYHVDDTSSVVVPSETYKSVVDQSPVGSVFQINPVTGHLDDVLSQVVQDPTSEKSKSLLPYLEPVGRDSNQKLSDDELMAMVRSRYIDSPTELSAFAASLASYADEANSQDVKQSESKQVDTVQPEQSSESSSDNS